MAERSTAAVDVTNTGGKDKPLAADTGEDTDDGVTEGHSSKESSEPATESETASPPAPPDLHSGHKLARRYRLEECVTRLDGFSSWRAVDEKLRRAVGVHVLPADHPRARPVLDAARSAALLGDPRFVQILDAVEDNDLVHVVQEWLPDATPLSGLLASGPLSAHEACQLVTHLSQALAAAHEAGLAHLRLTPGSVLRTGSGQYRIRGLAVSSALRDITSEHPQRTDTEAIGALLYAALTQRWPYEEDAYGLSGVGALAKGALVAPDQVRAGVHRGLSDLAMRALVNDGATACRAEQPCATPAELATAVAALPRIPPPTPDFGSPPPFQHGGYGQGGYRRGGYGPGGTSRSGAVGGPPYRTAPQQTPPALPGRTGKALKWGVSALLIAALGLGSWQVADILMNRDAPTDNTPGHSRSEPGQSAPGGDPITIVDAKDFDPEGNGSENPDTVADAYDGDPETFWYTRNYYGRSDFGGLKSGAGVIIDLGKLQEVGTVRVDFEGRTSAELLAAPKSTTGMPTSYDSFRKLMASNGQSMALKADDAVETQYVLVWLTDLPLATDGNYRGRITEIQVSG